MQKDETACKKNTYYYSSNEYIAGIARIAAAFASPAWLTTLSMKLGIKACEIYVSCAFYMGF